MTYRVENWNGYQIFILKKKKWVKWQNGYYYELKKVRGYPDRFILGKDGAKYVLKQQMWSVDNYGRLVKAKIGKYIGTYEKTVNDGRLSILKSSYVFIENEDQSEMVENGRPSTEHKVKLKAKKLQKIKLRSRRFRIRKRILQMR